MDSDYEFVKNGLLSENSKNMCQQLAIELILLFRNKRI